MNYDKFKPILGIGPPKEWGYTGELDDRGDPIVDIDLQMKRYFEYLESLLKQGPLIGTPKYDGIRCSCKPDGFPFTRSLKDIPNGSIRAYFFSNRQYIKPCLDGELVVGDSFNASTSGIMSFGGDPDFTYWIFDVPSDKPYKERVDEYSDMEEKGELPIRFKTVPTVWIKDIADLIAFEQEALKAGFEGIMLRTPNSPYKFGRSTLKQGYLLKVKRFKSAEAIVTGFEPLQSNQNEATTNALGYQERSSKKEGMITQNTLGKINVVGLTGEFKNAKFNIGSGFSQAQRDTFWENQPLLIGKIVEYKYQPHGALNAPRLPIFLRFRDAHEFSDRSMQEVIKQAEEQLGLNL